MEWWAILLISLGCVIGGGLIGAYLGYRFTKKAVSKEMDENPPINENMIRAMYTQMGRKPSETQVRQVMNAMKRQQRTLQKK